MHLEAQIDTLIATIKENTAALVALRNGPPAAAPKADKKTAAAPAPAPEPAKASEPEKPTLTVADIRTAAQKILDAGGPKHIRPLLTKYGVEKISAVAPEKYADVLADLAIALTKTEEDAKEKAVV